MVFGEPAGSSSTQMAVSSSGKSEPKKMVKFTGGGDFGGEQSNNNHFVAAEPKKFVKFTGGGEFSGTQSSNSTVFTAASAASNEMNRLAGGVAAMDIAEEDCSKGAYFEECDDGGMMFSTGD